MSHHAEPSVALTPIALRRWRAGDKHGQPFIVTVRCPFCRTEHSHAISPLALLQGFTWTCADHFRRHGRYRLDLISTARAMQDAMDLPAVAS